MPRRERTTHRYRLAAGFWLAAIFLLTLWPRPPEVLPDLPSLPGADKATHALLYGVEGWLIVRGWSGGPGRGGSGVRVLRVLAVIAVVAAVNETLQRFFPPRTPEWGDYAADVLGGLLGAWLSVRRENRES
ncbi:MAG TPA: VanZ family protein [Thermoanaerobaculia bacterium]